VVYLVFIIFSLISVFFALEQSVAIIQVRTIFLIWILMVALVNYIDTFYKLEKAIKYFVYSGFIASIYILYNSDFSRLTRFGGELGNVNSIGMIIGISMIFCFYFILERNKRFYIPIILINLTVIFLTGSRKSLLFIVAGIIILIMSKNHNSISGKLKAIIVSIVFFIVIFYLAYNIPIFYHILGKRLTNLVDFISGEGTNEGSINVRANMIELGWYWFKQRPITGYGINNFRILYGVVDRYTYSHNNAIELLVGTGIFGFLSYYLSQIIIIKDLLKTSNSYSKLLCYSFVAIISAYILMSVGLIYYYNKHISIIFALGSIIIRLSKKKAINNIERAKLND
jgi:O-antigen ligase